MRGSQILRVLALTLVLAWTAGCGNNLGASSGTSGGWSTTPPSNMPPGIARVGSPGPASPTPSTGVVHVRASYWHGWVQYHIALQDASGALLAVTKDQISASYDGQSVSLTMLNFAMVSPSPGAQPVPVQPEGLKSSGWQFDVRALSVGSHVLTVTVNVDASHTFQGQCTRETTVAETMEAALAAGQQTAASKVARRDAAASATPIPTPVVYNGPAPTEFNNGGNGATPDPEFDTVTPLAIDQDVLPPDGTLKATIFVPGSTGIDSQSILIESSLAGWQGVTVDGALVQPPSYGPYGYQGPIPPWESTFFADYNKVFQTFAGSYASGPYLEMRLGFYNNVSTMALAPGYHKVTFQMLHGYTNQVYAQGSLGFTGPTIQYSCNYNNQSLGAGAVGGVVGFVVGGQFLIENLQATPNTANNTSTVTGQIVATDFTPTNPSWNANILASDGRIVRNFQGTDLYINFTWDGLDGNGRPVPLGSYKADVTATCDEGLNAEQFVDMGGGLGYSPPNPRGTNNTGNGSDSNASDSDPVNGLTGSFYYQQTDISIPAPGLPLTVSRLHQTQQLTNSNMPAVWNWNVVSWMDEAASGTDTIKLTYPDGRWGQFESNDQVHFTPVASYAGLTDTITKNTDGSCDLISKDGSKAHFVFYQANSTDVIYLLTFMQDRFGNSLTWQYNNGAITAIQASNGRSLRFQMDPIVVSGEVAGSPAPFLDVRIYQITDDLGRTWVYNNYVSVPGAGSAPGTVTYPGNRTWSYTYDPGGRILTIADPKGHLVISNTYDSTDSRVVHQERDGGDFWDYGYATDTAHLAGPPASGTPNPLTTIARSRYGVSQGVQTYVYDQATGSLIWHADELLNVDTHTYDPATGRMLTSTDALGNVSHYQWDAMGNLLSTTDPLGATWTYQYEPTFNTLTQKTSPLGQVWRYQRDSLGLLTSTVDPLGNTGSFTYNPAGQPLTLTDPLGNTATIDYNAHGDVVGVVNPLHQKTAYHVDAVGRTKAVVDPLGDTTTQTLDAGDRVTSVQDALGNTTTFTWDHCDNLLSTVDALNRTTTFAYNLINQVTRVTDALGGVTHTGYDDRDNVRGVTDANGTLTAAYTQNQSDDTTRESLAGDASVLAYDGDHRVVSRRTPNKVTLSYGYDADGRLTSRTSSDGTVNVRYHYDAVGRRTEMDDALGTTTYQYDDDNRLTAKTQYGHTIQYAYDAASRLTSRTDPAGLVTAFVYDRAGRITKAHQGTWSVAFTYDSAGRVVSKAFSNGSVCTMAYDSDNRVTGMQWAGPAPASFAYTYDAVGNRTSATETGSPQGAMTWQYQVDALNRLVQSVLTGTVTTNWTLDAVGNILAWDQTDASTGAHTRQTDSVNTKDQVVAVGQSPYVWDADGNLVSKTLAQGTQTTTYMWDAEDRLLGITFPDGTTEQNAYDGDGRRVATTNRQGVTTAFVWSGGDVLDDLNADGTLRMSYLVTGGVVQGARHGASQYAFQTDGLGNVRQVVDDSGALAASYDYQPYGALQGTAADTGVSADVTAYRFVGGLGVRYDQPSGLYFMRARWYDPHLGRFVSRDPIQIAGGLNVYQYSLANPVSNFDPTGLEVGYEYTTGHMYGPFDPDPHITEAQRTETFLQVASLFAAGFLGGNWVSWFYRAPLTATTTAALVFEASAPPGPTSIVLPSDMLKQALSFIKAAPPCDRANLLRNLINRIAELSKDNGWSARQMRSTNGATIFAGRMGHTVIVDAEGALWMGKASDLTTQGGAVTGWSNFKQMAPP